MPRHADRDHPIWIEGTPCCPICNAEVTCEYADTDGSTQQVTPYVCLPCDWVSSEPLKAERQNHNYLDDILWE